MVDYGGFNNVSAFGAPGLLNVYESNLRVAIGKSQFTQEVISHIAASDIAARRFLSGVDSNTDQPRIRWLLPDDKQRQEKYKLLSDLYFGRHDRHLRPEWMPSGKTMYKQINMMRFVTKIYVDLMMGGGVEVKTGNQLIDDYISEDAQLTRFFSDWATAASVFGFVALQVVTDDQGVDIIYVDPLTIYWQFKEGTNDDFEWVSKKIWVDPEEVEDPDGNWEFGETEDGNVPDGIIFEERHYRGCIEYYLYTVMQDEILEILDPQWFDEDLPDMDEKGFTKQETECEEFLLQIVPNTLIMKEFVSDYDDLIDLQASINLRATQRGRILNVHADPKLMLPESLQQKDIYTGEIIVRGLRDEVFFLAPEEYQFKPEYLTWDAQLDHVTRELEDDHSMLCTLAEISPTLVVGRDETFPESGAAYKMKLTPTLNRVNRKKKDFKYAMQVLLHTFITKVVQQGKLDALSMEALPSMAGSHDGLPAGDGLPETGYPDTQDDGGIPTSAHDGGSTTSPDPKMFIQDFCPTDIDIDFKPALPQDEKMMIERAAGQATISRRRILKTVDGMTDKEIEKELSEIDADQKGADEAMFPAGDDLGGTAFGGKGTSIPPGKPLSLDNTGGLNVPGGAAMQTDQLTSAMM